MRRKEARQREGRKMKLPIRFRDVRGWRNKVEWLFLRLFAVLAVAGATGCLSVARIPIPERTEYAEDGTVVRREWGDAMTRAARRVGPFPSMKIRYRILSMAWTEPPPGLKYRDLHDARGRRVAAPFQFCGLLIGLPLDLVADAAYYFRDARLHSEEQK